MNRKSLTLCSVAAVLLLAGCQDKQERITTVSVRFAMPPSEARYALVPVNQWENQENRSQYAQQNAQNNTVQDVSTQNPNQPSVEFTQAASRSYDEMNALAHADRYHVALWGGPFQGDDVTYSDLDLAPGDYTFALWEQDPATSVQGHLRVNAPSGALLDVLHKWQARLPELKQQVAYEAEIQGRANTDPEAFASFQRQLKALDRLGKKIDNAVVWEERWHERHAPEYEKFVDQAIVLMLPGDERLLDPRTKPAFCAADVQNVRTGDPLTKVLVVADYNTTRWKIQMVDGFTRELNACKNVLWEEVNRLERRKRILDITDHLHKHDAAFTANEWQLQAALTTIAAIDDQLMQLSERRVALAYESALTAPDESFVSLENEQHDLQQELTLLTAEKERLDSMFSKASTETPKRVDLAAARQRYVRAIDNVQKRMTALQDNRVAIGKLRDASQVLHRSSDARVLVSSTVNSDVPFYVQQAIAKNALLTVRLQSQDNLFVPRGADVAKARTASHKAYNSN